MISRLLGAVWLCLIATAAAAQAPGIDVRQVLPIPVLPALGGTGVNNGSYTVGLGGSILTAGALTTTGAFADTLAFPGAYTYTFPSASKTLMASDYSNGATLGAANALLTSNTTGIPNAVAITGLVKGNGASAPAAYGGASCTNQFPRSLDLNGAATCATVGSSDLASSLSLTTPSLGVATATSITANGAAPQIVLGVNTTTLGAVKMFGSTSGDLTINPAAVAGTASKLTFPAGITDFSATGGASQVLKQTSAGGAFTVATENFTDVAGTITATQGGVFTGTSNALMTGAGSNTAPNFVAITGLVLGGGASAPAAYGGSGTCAASNWITALSASGVKTCTQPANTDITGLGTMSTQNASAIAITGGTAAGLTGLGIRDTSAAFDLTLAGTSSTALTAGRTLTFDMKNVAHTLAFNATANTITFPNTASYTLVGSGDSGTVTNTMLAGSITASKLVGTDITTVGALTAGTIASGFGTIVTANTISTSAALSSTLSTDATSGTTGAVLSTGGMSAQKAIWAGSFLATSGTTLPTPTAGTIGVGGVSTVPTFAANGEGAVFLVTAGGLGLMGKGSTDDFRILNSAGSTACNLATGGVTFNCGAVTGGSIGTTGNFYVNGTTALGPAAGYVQVTGEVATPTMSANGEGAVYLVSTTGGLGLMGKGSTNDFTLVNAGGTSACVLGTSTTLLSCVTLTASGSTASTSGATGAITSGGGVGAAGAVWAGTFFAVSGTTLPAQAAGTLGIGGEVAAPTTSSNGEADIYITSTTGGLTLQAKGSTSDITLANSAGTAACTLSTGATVWNCGSFVPTGSTAPTVGMALPAAGKLGLYGTTAEYFSGASDIWDYGVTTASVLTLNNATTINSATFKVTTLAAATAIDVVCYTTVTGLFTEEPTATTCAVSDERKKVGMQSISMQHSLDTIIASSPISYYYTKEIDPDSIAHLGFGAQTLARIDPQLVEHDEHGVPNAVRYIELIPVTWAAIKQLNANFEAYKESHP